MDDDAEADDIMQCLIDNKHHPDMDEKCKAGIEHHQLVSTMCRLYRGGGCPTFRKIFDKQKKKRQKDKREGASSFSIVEIQFGD